MRLFVKVAELRSFARAATELNISNSSATRLVMSIEDRLGARLLNRTTRSLSLTDAGHLYLAQIRHVIDEIDRVEDTIASMHHEPIGSLKIAAPVMFGMHVLAHSVPPYNDELIAFGARYVELDELLRHADIVSLHCPLLPSTHHLINERTLARMKHGAMLINTGRGGLVDAQALVDALKSGQLGQLGLDVYEEESGLFFEDHSDLPLQDDVLARLLTFPNVIVTSHQAFFTREALAEIARTTLLNIEAWHAGAPQNVVTANR